LKKIFHYTLRISVYNEFVVPRDVEAS